MLTRNVRPIYARTLCPGGVICLINPILAKAVPIFLRCIFVVFQCVVFVNAVAKMTRQAIFAQLILPHPVPPLSKSMRGWGWVL